MTRWRRRLDRRREGEQPVEVERALDGIPEVAELLGSERALDRADQTQMALGEDEPLVSKNRAQRRAAARRLDRVQHHAAVPFAADAVGDAPAHAELRIEALEPQRDGSRAPGRRPCVEDE